MEKAVIDIKTETQNEIAVMYDGCTVDVVEREKNYSVVKPEGQDYPIFKIFSAHLKPAESKVLSAEKLFQNRFIKNEQTENDFHEDDLKACRAWYKMGVKDSHQNGRLERDLEWREAIKESLELDDLVDMFIRKHFENLKPL
jgi:hypothetical protein